MDALTVYKVENGWVVAIGDPGKPDRRLVAVSATQLGDIAISWATENPPLAPLPPAGVRLEEVLDTAEFKVGG